MMSADIPDVSNEGREPKLSPPEIIQIIQRNDEDNRSELKRTKEMFEEILYSTQDPDVEKVCREAIEIADFYLLGETKWNKIKDHEELKAKCAMLEAENMQLKMMVKAQRIAVSNAQSQAPSTSNPTASLVQKVAPLKLEKDTSSDVHESEGAQRIAQFGVLEKKANSAPRRFFDEQALHSLSTG